MEKRCSRPWNEVKAELLSDPIVAAEYEALRPEYEMLSRTIEAENAKRAECEAVK